MSKKIEVKGKEYEIRSLIVDDFELFSEILDKLDFNVNDFAPRPEDLDDSYETLKKKAVKEAIEEFQKEKGRKPNKKDLLELNAEIEKGAKAIVQNRSGIQMMINIGNFFARRIHKAFPEIKEFIGNLVGLSKDELGTMPLGLVKAVLTELFKDEDFLGFFQ